MSRRALLLMFASLALLLFTGAPFYILFGVNNSEEADWKGRVGETVPFDFKIEDDPFARPQIGVRSADFVKDSYAVDSYGNKYNVFAAEIAWNDAAVQSEFYCEVSYRNRINRQEWKFSTSATSVEYEEGIDFPRTFVPKDGVSRPRNEDACGILRDQQGNTDEAREKVGLDPLSDQDLRRSVTEYLPLPDGIEVDQIVITVNQPADDKMGALEYRKHDFTFEFDVF